MHIPFVLDPKSLDNMLDLANKYLSHPDRNVRDLAVYAHAKLLGEKNASPK